MSITVTRVKNISRRDTRVDRIKRGGLILYTNIDGVGTYFCMGIDRNSSDLSDFGGHRERDDPSIIHAAVREFNEESRRMLGFDVTVRDVADCICAYDRNMMLIFLEVGSGDISIIHSMNDAFTDMRYIIRSTDGQGNQRRNTSLEMRGLCWLSYDDVKNLLTTRSNSGTPHEDCKSVIFSPQSSVYFIRIYDIIANFWHASQAFETSAT